MVGTLITQWQGNRLGLKSSLDMLIVKKETDKGLRLRCCKQDTSPWMSCESLLAGVPETENAMISVSVGIP
ncbi:hypothetical protein CEXT_537921 [Caerostris extrusa]|uniref:Uncharacterized protein n=1 Tax=Caerostris extrusa TaxID=172846 RepID=A0AAV4XKF3_CAEEX|nr:hypothetical protein CEXT_537921 [Caerostris extrusa]